MVTEYSNGALNGTSDLRSHERKPAQGQSFTYADNQPAEYTESQAGLLDYIYATDKSAASVEEIHRRYFRSAISANDQMGDWYPDHYLPRKRRRPERRYWVVDRDKVESWLKLAGQAVFIAAIAALTVSILVGIFG